MKALIVYDSLHGNTEQITRAVGDVIGGEVKIVRAGEVDISALESVELLIVGSPTQGARQSPDTQKFLDKIPAGSLKNVAVAAFDTRISARSGTFGTRVIAGLAGGFGYAAKRISKGLVEKGGREAVPPEGFIVQSVTGPLKDGESERAAAWVKKLVASQDES